MACRGTAGTHAAGVTGGTKGRSNMAWNDDTQVHIALLRGNVEASEVTLVPTAGGGTVEVPTLLSKIFAAYCTWKDNPARADQPHCDCVITNGQVTVSCQDPAGNEKVSVLLVGLA